MLALESIHVGTLRDGTSWMRNAAPLLTFFIEMIELQDDDQLLVAWAAFSLIG